MLGGTGFDPARDIEGITVNRWAHGYAFTPNPQGPGNTHTVNISFEHAEKKTTATFAGPVSLIAFGREQYPWHADRNGGIADPDGPG